MHTSNLTKDTTTPKSNMLPVTFTLKDKMYIQIFTNIFKLCMTLKQSNAKNVSY